MAKKFISDAEMASLEKSSAPKKFISDDEMISLEKPQPNVESSVAQTVLESGGQGLLSGYLPHLQAKAEPLTDRLFNLFSKEQVEPASISQLTENSPEYLAARDANIARIVKQAEENPKTALASEIVGGLLSAAAVPIPGLGASKGLAGAALKGASSGGLQSLVQNPGDEVGIVDPLQVEKRIKGAALGAATGGILGGVTKGVGSAVGLLSKGGKASKEAAEELAFMALGPRKGFYKSANAKNEVNKVGRTLLDEGIVKAGDTIDEIAEKTMAKMDDVGKNIGAVYDKAKSILARKDLSPDAIKKINETKLDPTRWWAEATDIVEKDFKGLSAGDAVINRASKDLEAMAAHYGDNISYDDARKLLKSWDAQINFAKRSNELPQYQQAAKKIRNYLRDKINENVEALGDAVGDSGLKKELSRSNKLYHDLATAKDIVSDKLSAESANRLFGLTELGVGGMGTALPAGSALGKGAIGLGLALAAKGAKKYGIPAIAGGLDEASPYLEKLEPIARGLLKAKIRGDIIPRAGAGLIRERE